MIMKKSLLLSLLLVMVWSIQARDRVVSFTELPAQIQQYIQQHFANHTTVKSEIDQDGMNQKYEVKFQDGLKIEFDKNGNPREINSHQALPTSVIPKAISNYVNTHYNAQYIKEWSLKKYSQQVELSNGVELKFDLKGNFLKIDR